MTFDTRLSRIRDNVPILGGAIRIPSETSHRVVSCGLWINKVLAEEVEKSICPMKFLGTLFWIGRPTRRSPSLFGSRHETAHDKIFRRHHSRPILYMQDRVLEEAKYVHNTADELQTRLQTIIPTFINCQTCLREQTIQVTRRFTRISGGR